MSTLEKIADVKSAVVRYAKASRTFIPSVKTGAYLIGLILFGMWSFHRGLDLGSKDVVALTKQIESLRGDLDLEKIQKRFNEAQAASANRKLEELGTVKNNAEARLAAQKTENTALQKKVDDYVSKLGKSKDGKRSACTLSPDDVRGLLSIR